MLGLRSTWENKNRQSSPAPARCILFFVVAVSGMSVADVPELLGFGDTHYVFRFGRIWRDCSHTNAMPSVCGDAFGRNQSISNGSVRYIPFSVIGLIRMSTIKP